MLFADQEISATQALRCLRRAYCEVEDTPPRFAALLERLRDAADETPRAVELRQG